jgi:8-oxo-dGTP pyrophosphatase MutT (NUDIX family)
MEVVMTKWLYCPECKSELTTNSQEHPSCPNGHFTKYPTPVAAATGFVRFSGKFLALKRNMEPFKESWDLPGGFVEPNETAEEALLREIREETGLEAEIKEYVGAFPATYGDTGVAVLGIIYLADSLSDKVVLDNENYEYAWFGLEDIPEPAFGDCQRALEVLKERLGKS